MEGFDTSLDVRLVFWMSVGPKIEVYRICWGGFGWSVGPLGSSEGPWGGPKCPNPEKLQVFEGFWRIQGDPGYPQQTRTWGGVSLVDGKLLQQIGVAFHIALLYSINQPGKRSETHGWLTESCFTQIGVALSYSYAIY